MAAVLHWLPQQVRQHLWEPLVHAPIGAGDEAVKYTARDLLRLEFVPRFTECSDLRLFAPKSIDERVEQTFDVRLFFAGITSAVILVITHRVQHCIDHAFEGSFSSLQIGKAKKAIEIVVTSGP